MVAMLENAPVVCGSPEAALINHVFANYSSYMANRLIIAQKNSIFKGTGCLTKVTWVLTGYSNLLWGLWGYYKCT